MSKTNMEKAMAQFVGKGEAFIICGPSEPHGEMGLAYQGDLHQLKGMYRHIRDTLKDKEQIGNHPRRDKRPSSS